MNLSAIRANDRSFLNIARKMTSGMSGEMLSAVMLISELAQKESKKAYLVGGFVRDLILGVKNLDLDVVLEGNAISFTRRFAENVKGSLVAHAKFGTATVVMSLPGAKSAPRGVAARPEKLKIDFAAARKEIYKKPAALPMVKFASLRDDLYRRDFTINAMAASINKNDFGELVDFFGGLNDLRRGVIKVLHKGSFIDDPTRIFRAVRFEQRFGFTIEPGTICLIKDAINLKMLERTHPHRILNEIEIILKEKNPLNSLKRMEGLGQLRVIHPRVKFNKKNFRYFKSIQKAAAWFIKTFPEKPLPEAWVMYFAAMLESVSFSDDEMILAKFGASGKVRARVLLHKKESADIIKLLSKRNKLAPSIIYRRLKPLPHENVLLILARDDNSFLRKRIFNFLSKYENIKLSIRGQDLKECGLSPGPSFKNILNNALNAKLDGRIVSRDAQLKFVRNIIKT